MTSRPLILITNDDGVLSPGLHAAAEAVIDLVGGVLGEVAKRRAERQAAEAANPQQPQPPLPPPQPQT